MIRSIQWLILTNLGRYVLAAILIVFGAIFSPDSTIDFLSTDSKVFTYIMTAGMILLIGQFIYHIFYAIISNLTNK